MIWTRETVESTAEVVDRAADEFEHKAAELRRMAKAMREEGDLSIAGEAIGTIVSLANIRAPAATRAAGWRRSCRTRRPWTGASSGGRRPSSAEGWSRASGRSPGSARTMACEPSS